MIPDCALINAIKRDNELDFRAALAAGASLAARDVNGASPLEVAESRGASNTAREILALGADLNQRLGTHKRTLLHRAVRKRTVAAKIFGLAIVNWRVSFLQ